MTPALQFLNLCRRGPRIQLPNYLASPRRSPVQIKRASIGADTKAPLWHVPYSLGLDLGSYQTVRPKSGSQPHSFPGLRPKHNNFQPVLEPPSPFSSPDSESAQQVAQTPPIESLSQQAPALFQVRDHCYCPGVPELIPRRLVGGLVPPPAYARGGTQQPTGRGGITYLALRLRAGLPRALARELPQVLLPNPERARAARQALPGPAPDPVLRGVLLGGRGHLPELLAPRRGGRRNMILVVFIRTLFTLRVFPNRVSSASRACSFA